MNAPDFISLSKIEEDVLEAQLQAVRFAISHAGEKGRALEQPVRNMLRKMLPPEYGLTTGFVAWNSPDGPRLSTQLDIIIYDAIRHGPLIRLDSCDVVALEAVYGYVEVKASIRSSAAQTDGPPGDSLEACCKTNAAIREMRDRYFLVTEYGSPMTIDVVKEHWLAPRAYVVAFEAQGGIGADADRFAVSMADALKRQGNAHIHGILVPNHGFFYTRPVHPESALEDDYFHVRYTTDRPLLAFRSVLAQGLASFQRAPSDWAPALDIYFEHAPPWAEQVPSKGTDMIIEP
jgi:hypothetical protein